MSDITICICWGYFDYLRFWYPNLNIDMTPDEQYNENVKNGYLP